MALVGEILLGLGVLLVALTYLGVMLERLPERWVLIAAAVVTVFAGAAGVLLVIGVAIGNSDWDILLVAFAGLLLAAAAEGGAYALARGLRRIRATEAEGARMQANVDAVLEAHTEMRARELQQTLARERAETVHLLAEQERTLREERREAVERQTLEAGAALVQTVTNDQQRFEQRLAAWSSDLERAQQQLKVRLEDLIRQQADALQGHEARLAEHAKEVEALEEVQHASIARVRIELERSLAESHELAKAEIETHAAERRRALHEVGERLRTRERSMREQIEREEGEVRTQLSQVTDEVERRQVEQLERLLDRSVMRLSEDAERRFDAQLRESREKTAERLARELELSMETFTRSAEKEVAARIAEAAQVSATKLQRQIDDVVRAAEVQTAISNERIQALTARLERSLEAANERLAEFEATVELELSAKLGEIERALRAAEQTVDRERA